MTSPLFAFKMDLMFRTAIIVLLVIVFVAAMFGWGQGGDGGDHKNNARPKH